MRWATGSRPRAWAGLFTAEASFTAQRDFELFFFLIFFFFPLDPELEIRFYPRTNFSHVVARSIDSRPANERFPPFLDFGRGGGILATERTRIRASPRLNVTECHGPAIITPLHET